MENQPNENGNIKKLALKILTEKTAYAFEGGGVLGAGHAGALVRLYELGGLKQIDYVVGTSVGSIISMALACGATTYYIKEKLFDLNLNRFEDGGNFISKAFRFIFSYGIHKGDELERFAEEILTDLTDNPNITFLQAYERFGTHLTITYLSSRYRRTKYADHITSPDLPIKKAVRWSSTIPFFFKASRHYNKNRELYDLLVDGGVMDNYPLHVLKEQNQSPQSILGFKLCDNNERNEYQAIKDDTIDQEVDHGLPQNIKDFSVGLLDILRHQALRYHVHKEDWKLTCKIDIGSYKTTDFTMTEDDKLWLYNSGRDAVDQHLSEIESLLISGSYPLE